MEIEAPVPASEIPSIKVGQPVRFRVDGFGDRQFDGRVERINPHGRAGLARDHDLRLGAQRGRRAEGGMFAKGGSCVAARRRRR